ncbi:MAG: hypothetical protein SGPRY_010029 [Prymnesium sp.]
MGAAEQPTRGLSGGGEQLRWDAAALPPLSRELLMHKEKEAMVDDAHLAHIVEWAPRSRPDGRDGGARSFATVLHNFFERAPAPNQPQHPTSSTSANAGGSTGSVQHNVGLAPHERERARKRKSPEGPRAVARRQLARRRRARFRWRRG